MPVTERPSASPHVSLSKPPLLFLRSPQQRLAAWQTRESLAQPWVARAFHQGNLPLDKSRDSFPAIKKGPTMWAARRRRIHRCLQSSSLSAVTRRFLAAADVLHGLRERPWSHLGFLLSTSHTVALSVALYLPVAPECTQIDAIVPP